MSAWSTAFYLTNATSGLVLVALGVLAAARAGATKRLALPLFLIVTGTRYVLSNSGVAAYAKDAAFTMFLLIYLFLPLQAVLLLRYAQEEATQHPRIRRTAQVAVIVVVAVALLGGAIAILDTPQVLKVTQADDGSYDQQTGWGTVLFEAPNRLAIPLGLLLLSWSTPPAARRHWGVLCGVTAAVGWSFSWSMGYDLQHPDDQAFVTIPEAIFAVLLLVATAGSMVYSAHSSGQKRARNWALAVLGAILVATVSELPDWDPLWYFGSPGLWRLAAAATFLVPVVLVGWRLNAPRGRAFALFQVLGLVAATAAIGALAHLEVAMPDWVLLLAAGLGLVALVVTALLAVGPFLRALSGRVAQPDEPQSVRAVESPARGTA